MLMEFQGRRPVDAPRSILDDTANMRNLLRRLAPGILLVALGSVVTAAVFAWEPWDGEREAKLNEPTVAPETRQTATPTPYQPRLTGPEAAAIVRTTINRRSSDNLSADQSIPLVQLDSCESTDFNDRLLAWVVECEASALTLSSGNKVPLGTHTYRLYDSTQTVEPVLP